MLEIKIEHFLDYCKVSNFATKSIQSLSGHSKIISQF